MTHTYVIIPSNIFSADLYPQAVDELMEVKRRSSQMNTPLKGQVVISFLKDHSITTKWLESDPAICKLMTSGSLKISHLESLFSASQQNQKFRDGLEAYIKSQL